MRSKGRLFGVRLIRTGVLLLVAVLALGPVTPAAASGAKTKASYQERKLLKYINKARERRGIPKVRMRAKMRKRAHAHSHRMANNGRVFHHRCLSCVSPNPYRAIGENVIAGGGMRNMHRRLMRSKTHRKIILCRCFRRVGTGVVKARGRLWVTQRFWG